MPDKQTFNLGDDGEMELVEEPSWQDEKAKRSAPLWHRIRRSSLIPTLVLAQTGCIGLLCIGIVLVVLGGFDPIQMRCRILDTCPTPTVMIFYPTMDPTITLLPTLTPTPAVDPLCTSADFAGSTPKLAFISDRQSPFGAAYLTDLNGSFVCHVLTSSEGLDNVAWSEGEQRLAFTTRRGILRTQANGTVSYIPVGPITTGEPIRWSPDNQQLLYVSELPNGGMGIATVRPTGDDQRLLTSTPARDRAPDWSPDGSQIVFSSNRDGNTGIYVMNADGSNVHRLTLGLANGDHPDWSPDGTRITFAADQDGNRDIYAMNTDGSDIRRLTDSGGRDDFPRWSPDGKQIVFVSYRDGNNELYLMDASGANPRRLTSDRADDTRPVWLPWQTAQ